MTTIESHLGYFKNFIFPKQHKVRWVEACLVDHNGVLVCFGLVTGFGEELGREGSPVRFVQCRRQLYI
jgi:hypothetical protein